MQLATPASVIMRAVHAATAFDATALPRAISPDRRVRVMQVVHSLNAGGTERLVIEITKALEPWADFVVCCLDAPGSWASELTSRGVPVETLGRRAGFRPGLGCEIARLASAHAVDVLHCHHYPPFVYGQIAALVTRGLRVVFTEHGRLSDALPSVKRRLINPVLGRLPSAVFAVSSDLRHYMTLEGFTARRVRVIHNCVDVARIDQHAGLTRASAKVRLGIPPDQPVVGAAGRLVPQKAPLTFVQAARQVAAAAPGTLFVWVGSGPLQATVANLARAEGIPLRLLGHREDVWDCLRAFDVFVLASRYEGLSFSLLEAMALRLPVVVTDVVGTRDVVDDQVSGLVVPADVPAGLADAILSLLQDPPRGDRLADAARKKVVAQFSVERMLDSHQALYEELCAR